jgi:hypothetical protein
MAGAYCVQAFWPPHPVPHAVVKLAAGPENVGWTGASDGAIVKCVAGHLHVWWGLSIDINLGYIILALILFGSIGQSCCTVMKDSPQRKWFVRASVCVLVLNPYSVNTDVLLLQMPLPTASFPSWS